jgi:hypothetical protein
MESDYGSDGFKQVKNDFALPGSAIVRINGKSGPSVHSILKILSA